jgi:hypothetical protein
MVSQAQKLVVFGSASKKALELFVGCFQDLTGLSLERITAFTMARDWASSFKPDPDEDYVGKEDIDTAELPKLNSGDGNDLYQGLGCDFLSFLANRAVKQTSVPVGSDKWEVASYDKVEIASPADYKFKVSGNGTQDSGLLEQAVVDGGVVLSGFFELKDQDEQAWPLAFSAKTFGVGNLKLPQEKGEKNEAGARFVRGELVDEFFIALTGIFKAFMDTRVLATWSKLWTVKGKK